MGLLSIVLPCYNEAQNIAQMYRRCTAEFHPVGSLTELEILIIDDGSVDETSQVAQNLVATDSRVRLLSLSRNFGKEAAMKAGLDHAAGEAVVIMDADMQHPPALLQELMDGYAQGFHQVIAVRDRSGEGILRAWLSRCYYRLSSRLINVPLQDGAGDFRLLSRKAVEALRAMPEYNRFSKGMFAWVGLSSAQVKYPNQQRHEGSSSWSFRSLLNYGLDGIIAFNDRPLRLAVKFGLTAFMLFVAYLLFLVVNVLISGIEVPGYVTTIAVIVGVGGIQLVGLGVLGEYLGKIYSEVKRRPHYVIERDSKIDS